MFVGWRHALQHLARGVSSEGRSKRAREVVARMHRVGEPMKSRYRNVHHVYQE